MKLLLCMVVFMTCALQPVLAAYPVIEASVNASAEGMVYAYELMNVSQMTEVRGFSLYIPESVVPAIISLSGPTDQWQGVIQGRPGLQWRIFWFVNGPTPGIQPDSSGCFTLITNSSVPSGYDYAPQHNTNWTWADWSSEYMGNTIIPVPVPEPSSLLALAAGLVPLAGLAIRRRK